MSTIGIHGQTPVPIQDVAITEPIGQQPMATSVSITLATDEDAIEVIGPLTDTELRAASVDVNTELPAPVALSDDTANPTSPSVGAFGMMYDGATWDRIKGNTTDGLLVDLGANNGVTGVVARDDAESVSPLYLPIAGRQYSGTPANAKAKPISMITAQDAASFYLDSYPAVFVRNVSYLRMSDGGIAPQTNQTTTTLFSDAPGIVTHVLNEQRTVSATLDSVGASISIIMSDYPVDSVMFSLDGNAYGFTGTLKAYILVDGGSNPCDLWDIANNSWVNGNDIDINGKYRILLAPTAGASRIVLEVTALTSGKVVAKARGGPGAVNFPWIIKSKTTTLSSPSIGTSSGTILAANVMRLNAIIQNEGLAICYIKFGDTASLTSYSIQLASDAYYELKNTYTGIIDGITSSGTSQLRVTEFTGY